jgi:hypothetical protein
MIVHLLKAQGWPLSDAVPHWQGEARGFHVQARRKYRASMAREIDLPGLYTDALRALPDTIDGTASLPLSHDCPWALDHLLSDDAEL